MKNKRQKQNTSEGTQHWQNKVNNINQKKERKQNKLKLIAKWNKNKQIKLKQYKKCTVCVRACVCVYWYPLHYDVMRIKCLHKYRNASHCCTCGDSFGPLEETS